MYLREIGRSWKLPLIFFRCWPEGKQAPCFHTFPCLKRGCTWLLAWTEASIGWELQRDHVAISTTLTPKLQGYNTLYESKSSRYCNDVPSGGFDRNIKSFNISLSRRLVPKIRRLVTFLSNALPSHGEVVTSLAFDFRRRQRAKFWTHCAARCSDGFGMFWAHLLNPTAKFNWRNNIFIHRRRACFLLLGLSWIDAVLLSILHGMFSTWHLWTAKYHPFSPLDGHGVVMALP